MPKNNNPIQQDPQIAYTCGDPAGIGMDIILKAAQNHLLEDVVAIANVDWLHFRAEKLGISIDIVEPNQEINAKGQLKASHFETKEEHSAFYTMGFLDQAIQGCLDAQYSAMVTGPVNKAVIHEAGFDFMGHTEYIACLLYTSPSPRDS